VLDTVMFYVGQVAGPDAIAGDVSPGLGWTEDLARGNVCAIFTPDWEADYLKRFAPALSGKVRMRELPTFEPSDAPTCTWGGTMVGICRSCRQPALAWKLLEFLYLSPQAAQARLAAGDRILPAIPEYWDDPAYLSADAFFADDQSIGRLYAKLAAQIPERFMTPYTYQAELALAEVLQRCADYVEGGGAIAALRPLCANWLREAQDELQRRIDFGNAS
jgi:ABC-type glycerol-3-phosphate transport system substrate-binding protein